MAFNTQLDVLIDDETFFSKELINESKIIWEKF